MLRRAAIVLLAAGLTTTAFAQQADKQSSKQPDAAKAQPQSAQAQPASAAMKPMPISRLAGDFDGSIQVRDGKMMSGSMANVAARMQESGEMLIAFDGFIKQEKVNGLVRISGSEGQMSLSIADSRYSKMIEAEQQSSSDGSLVFMSSSGDTRHVLRMQDNRLILERFAVSKEGKQSLMFTIDAMRLPADQKAAAAQHISSPALLAKLGASPQPAIASVPDKE